MSRGGLSRIIRMGIRSGSRFSEGIACSIYFPGKTVVPKMLLGFSF